MVSTKWSNLLGRHTINFLWKVQWFSTYNSKCLHLTQRFVFIRLDISTVSSSYYTCYPHTGNRVINMRVLLEWYKILRALTNCSYCSNAIMQIICISLIIVIVKKCQKWHFLMKNKDLRNNTCLIGLYKFLISEQAHIYCVRNCYLDSILVQSWKRARVLYSHVMFYKIDHYMLLCKTCLWVEGYNWGLILLLN